MGIGVLGPLTCDGRVIGRRDRAVLSALALYVGRPLTADQLTQAVWGDQPTPSSRKALQGCVVRLRRELGAGHIDTSAHGYTLEVPTEEVDAHRFERLTLRGRELMLLGEPERAASMVAQALDLWRGAAYEDVESWDPAIIESARLQELRLEAEELRVDASLRAGLHLDVLAAAESMVQAAPLREQRWTLLARAQYQAGSQADALRTIRRVKSLLADKLGLDAGPELASLEEAILRQDDSLLVGGLLPASPTCPYRGLSPYDVDDAESFFGREPDLLVCLDLLRRSGSLTVVGPSGCGKSSLVRAGIAATLRREGRTVVVLSPGAHPMQSLAAAPDPTTSDVLVVDQCEEVFSLCRDEGERSEFLAELARRSLGPGTVVVAMRADRVSEMSVHPGFARLVERSLHLLGGMSEQSLREAIEEPARQSGLLIEAGLVDLLVGEVAGTPGALPLMSHALMETWNRREGRTLTVAGYAASGGIRGAVARSAETVYAGIEEGERHVLRDLVLRLVTAGAEGEPVRSRVPRRLLSTDPEHERLIDLLVSSRLVTSDAGVVEIAHEALARAWPRLQGWLEEDVEGQRILHHLSTAADSWDLLGRVDSELYRGARLSQALEWRARGNPTLTGTETAFLDAAEQAEESERRAAEVRARAQARQIRRQRGLLAGAAVLLLATVAAGAAAVRQTGRADANAVAALDAETAAEARGAGARALATDDVDTSMLLAVAGVRLDDSAATRANLLATLQQRPQLVRSVAYDGDPITGLDVSPDGASVAVYDRRSGLRLYDTTTWKTLAEVPRNDDRIPLQWTSPVAFSPDGALLAAGPAGVVRDPILLLAARTLDPAPVRLAGIPSGPLRVVDVAFSANGRALAATIQRLERLEEYGDSWFPATTELLVWELHDSGRVPLSTRVALPEDGWFRWSRLALSPDGRTAYTSMPLSAYDVESGRVLYSRTRTVGRLGVRNTTSNFFELNPAGTLLAVTEPPGRLLLLDARTGRVRRELRGHSDEVRAVRFSHDGRSLASSSRDRTVMVWDVATGGVRERLRLGEGAIALAFSPDDTLLYTAGDDRAMRVWDLQGASRFLSTAVEPESELVGTLAPAPGGGHVMAWQQDGLAFYDVAEDRWTGTVGQGRLHESATWNSAGTLAASVGDGFLNVWDPAAADVVRETHLDGVYAAADFSPDDTTIAIMSLEGELSLLDAATLEPVGLPMQLESTGGALSLGPEGVALVLTPGYSLDLTYEHTSHDWVLADLDTGQVLRRGSVDFDAVWLASSPDGRHAAITGLGGELMILDLVTGEAVGGPTVGHATTVWGTVYSRDGSRIVTTGEDGSVSLWDGVTGELLGSVLLPEKVTSSAAFGADESVVVIASDYDGLYSWDTSTAHLVDFACRLAGRDLTEAEWLQYFGPRPWQPTCPTDAP